MSTSGKDDVTNREPSGLNATDPIPSVLKASSWQVENVRVPRTLIASSDAVLLDVPADQARSVRGEQIIIADRRTDDGRRAYIGAIRNTAPGDRQW
jgi:hypothetical protein